MRQYLLGQLPEADEEKIELRLLTDVGYSKEYGIIENELVDEYVEGTLTAKERIQFEQYFLKAPERRDKLAFATALSRAAQAPAPMLTASAHKPPPVPWYSFQPFYLKAATVIIIAVCLGVGIWLFLVRRSEEEQGMESLRAAYKDQRLIEARITSLEYAPLISTRGQDNSKINEAALRQAELQLLNNLNARPDAKAHHDLGRFYLAGAQFDKAIEEFEKSLTQAPNDPQIHSDLGAALLADGQQAAQNNDPGKAFTLLAKSLQNIDKALQAKPDLLEALYNKALCLQYMKLPEQAKAAWQNYLAHDSQSKWAEEAKRNLQSLSTQSALRPTASQLLDSFLAAYRGRDNARAWEIVSSNRDIITGKMIAPQLERSYISLMLNGQDESAQERLRAFLYAGELDEQRGGDPFTSELAHYYAASSAAQRRLLAGAIENLDQGYQLCLDARYGEAAQHFERARNLFNSAGNRWEERLADYWIAYCLTQSDKVRESIDRLKDISNFCERSGYKWLLAQAYGWLAINYSILSEHSDAIKYYESSLALSEALSDYYQMQKVLTELGNEYAELRQPQMSLGYYYRSLSSALQTNSSPRQSWRNFSYATITLFTFKYYEAAAAFANESLLLGKREFDDPSLNYLMYLNLGQIYSKLQRFDEAVAYADLGLQIARSTQDKTASRKLIANALLQLAHIWRGAGSCDQANDFYNRAIELYEQMEFDVYRFAAYKGRLLCSLALKDEARIQQDLPTLLNLYERQRFLIREEQNRNNFFDTEQDAYDIAIEYEYEKHNYLKAIDYAEIARARSLLDALQSGGQVEETATGPDVVFSHVSNPSNLESIRRCLPSNAQIVMYTVLPTKVLIWKISRDGVTSFEENITAEILEADVQNFVDALNEGTTKLQQSSRELGMKLHRILLSKVEKALVPGEKVCLIPDKFLYHLPFIALNSPETGKYFVEDWTVFYAPSLNVLCHCSQAARGKMSDSREVVLSIGNPTFNPRSYPRLSILQAAEREARGIADIYGNTTSLIGAQATKKNTLVAMTGADVIHFAGHYLINESTPLLSEMLLADNNSQDSNESTLSAFEILRRHFNRTKLIVLSACQTGIDKYYGGEGAVGLSRTFIAAGVPVVVASQWPVESNGTADLMIGFHRHRQSGLPTAGALRKAQLDMLHGTDETYRLPYYWAAFLCVGGYSDY